MCQYNGFKIHKHIGIIESSKRDGWRKEINIVSWGDSAAKYEIREWKDGHSQHKRNAMRLTLDEVIELVKILKKDTVHRKVLRAATNGKKLIPYDKPFDKRNYYNAYLVEHIGVFSESYASRKEVNLIIWDSYYNSYGNGDVKYDLRWWDSSNSPYHDQGIRLTRKEAMEFINIMAKEINIDLDSISEEIDTITFNVQDDVRHPRFGRGVVTKINDDEITVYFSLKGEVKFSRDVIESGKLLEKVKEDNRIAYQEESDVDEYPVEFIEGVDFLGHGTVIRNVGELLCACSEKLYDLSDENIKFREFLTRCQLRYFAGDMGDGSEKEVRYNTIRFHEGLDAMGLYKTDMVDEGAILMGFVDDLCAEFPENPRDFIVLLPSENNLIIEWHERHPEM